MSTEGEPPPKPCCRRVILGAHQAWCIEPDGHAGNCRVIVSGRPLPHNDFMPRKR